MNTYFMDGLTEFSNYISIFKDETALNDLKYCNLYIIELKTKIKLINNQLDSISNKKEILNNTEKEVSKYGAK